MNRNEDTYMQLEDLGTRYPGYRPTFDFPAPFINTYHKFLSNLPLKKNILIKLQAKQPIKRFLTDHIRDLLIDVRNIYRYGNAIPGWLRREEALKLYELAYFSPGDILELGSYHGLSTTIMSQACFDSGGKKMIYTVDLDPQCIKATLNNLRKQRLTQGVAMIIDDGTSAVRRFADAKKQFSFVFIDHSHKYEHVLAICRELPSIVGPNSMCFFHDFNHAGNKDPKDTNYGVYQAVCDGLDQNQFEFYGLFGGAALFLVK